MTKQICFTADDDLAEKLDEMSEKLQRSRSDTINMLLKVAVKISDSGKLKEGG